MEPYVICSDHGTGLKYYQDSQLLMKFLLLSGGVIECYRIIFDGDVRFHYSTVKIILQFFLGCHQKY